MQEYVEFNFSFCGDNHAVSSLIDFFKRVNQKSKFTQIEHFPFFIARNVASGLSHLHNLRIAHRDLKPANILVSNQHFSNEKDLYQHNPIICKLADFGESRTEVLHTKAMLMTSAARKTSVTDISRGTIAYLPPEMLVER
eukprot:TCONS_00028514-protein